MSSADWTSKFREKNRKIKEEIKAKKIAEMEHIVSIICHITGLTLADLRRKLRKQNYVEARYVSVYMIRKYVQEWPDNKGKVPLTRIGAYLNRDHTTIIHGLEEIEYMIETKNKPYMDLINKFEQHYSEFLKEKNTEPALNN